MAVVKVNDHLKLWNNLMVTTAVATATTITIKVTLTTTTITMMNKKNNSSNRSKCNKQQKLNWTKSNIAKIVIKLLKNYFLKNQLLNTKKINF